MSILIGLRLVIFRYMMYLVYVMICIFIIINNIHIQIIIIFLVSHFNYFSIDSLAIKICYLTLL
jgi:hypothetical protein